MSNLASGEFLSDKLFFNSSLGRYTGVGQYSNADEKGEKQWLIEKHLMPQGCRDTALETKVALYGKNVATLW